MPRVAITGAGGFIGQRLAQRLLEEGDDVTAVLHRDRPLPISLDGCRHIRADVTRPETLQGAFEACDRVFHLAGCTLARTHADFYRVNCEGTANVARACSAATSPPKLILVSSLAALGPALGGVPLSESAAPFPVSDYGRSKLQAEAALREYCNRLPIQIVRPPSVMGESDRYMLGLFKTAKSGWVLLPGGIPYRYSMIHVDDLVRAMIDVSRRDDIRLKPDGCEKQATGNSDVRQFFDPGAGVVHLAHGPALTFVETARIVRDVFGGGDLRTISVPRMLCRSVARLNSIAARLFAHRPLLNVDKMHEALAGEWISDSTRLTRELGFRFPMTLEERIRQTVERYREKGWI